MKKLLLTLALGFTLTASAGDKLTTAGEVLLSPRAQDNQSKVVKGTDNSPNTMTRNQNITASPRTLDNQTKVAKGTDSSPNTIAGGCALGSPRQLEQAGKFTSGDCCSCTIHSESSSSNCRRSG